MKETLNEYIEMSTDNDNGRRDQNLGNVRTTIIWEVDRYGGK